MFGWDFLLMFSRDSEDEMWLRFMFELLIWFQEATLARWTQFSGPLCLWQCFTRFFTQFFLPNYIFCKRFPMCVRPSYLPVQLTCQDQRRGNAVRKTIAIGSLHPFSNQKRVIIVIGSHHPFPKQRKGKKQFFLIVLKPHDSSKRAARLVTKIGWYNL